jgi:hypothetical protein
MLSAPLDPPTWEKGVEVLAHFKVRGGGGAVLLEVNTSFLVIFV